MEISTEKPKAKPGNRPSGMRLPFRDLFKPHQAIPQQYYIGTIILSLIIILGAWSLVSYSGIVKPHYFLPTPTEVLETAGRMFQNGELAQHIQVSVFVIIVGWAVASLLAVPFGILMGSIRIFEAFVEPVVTFVRYLPVSALIPLLILYFGLGLPEKLAVVFIGTFFQLILLVADVSAHVTNDLLDSAYTLGASRLRVLTTVLAPATMPGVMDALRLTLGWAWTYVVVAELISAEFGLGMMIMESERGLRTDRIFVGLVTIGLLGFICDYIFKWLHRRLLPWSPRLR